MRIVGLLNRLFAWFGYRLLTIQAIESERLANARTVEDLDRRLSTLAEERDGLSAEVRRLVQASAAERLATTRRVEDLDRRLSTLAEERDGLTAEVERLARARSEDQIRFWAKLHELRSRLGNSRTAEALTREALERQARTFAERNAAETAAREGSEVELWGKIDALKSGLKAQQQAREAAARQAEERSEAQAEAHARTLGDLWARLEGERSRTSVAREIGAEARRKLDHARHKIEVLAARLKHEAARRAEVEAQASGELDPGSAMRASRKFRERGRLDMAVAALERASDLSNPKHDAYYRRQLLDLDDNPGLQRAVRRSIERLPATAESQAAYLTTLCQQADLVCLEPSSIERLLAKTERAARKSRSLRTARNAIRQRLEFGQAVRDRFDGHATLISLGLNCMPWSLPNRWRLRSPDEFVSLFTPFAYGVHKLKAILRALQTDFEDYCQLEKLKAVETKGGYLTPVRTDGLAFWNHNLGRYWIDDDFGKFRERMAQKIGGFRMACRAQDAVFMMSKAPIDYPAEPVTFLRDLNEGLERFTGRANNRVLLWNEYAETAGRHTVDPYTHVLNCPYPSADYVWYDAPENAETLAYEASCAQAVVDSLQEWGLLRVRDEAASAVAQAAMAVG